MALIHESKRIIYFVDEWKPKFNEAALLSDPEMLKEVTAINQQIISLAPVLNSPTIQGQATVSLDKKDVPIAIMMKQYNNEKYLFAVSMRNNECMATFTIKGVKDRKEVEVIGENQTVSSINGIFKDEFKPYDVHLYKIK